ncbi:hypothetical protein [Halosimplex marinum]|uniref:hypothetical protein n=1 Tax=Halosimplex marinum TaxID=3396620 RepID=UPI003F565BAA
MKRVVARFDDEDAASEAERSLRETDRRPYRPEVDDPFFDPSARLPEARGLAWGGLLGGLLGAAVMLAMAFDALWVPRLSPLMAAGQLELAVFGFGAGAAGGGFVGGLAGTYRDAPEPDGPRVAVAVPDRRADETATMLRGHGATAVEASVLVHEHPHRDRVSGVETRRTPAAAPADRRAGSNPQAESDAPGGADASDGADANSGSAVRSDAESESGPGSG